MKKLPYQQQLDSLISSLNGARPTLLLHACCGPCSSYVIEYLSEFFDITILYYNPNIFPRDEYERRLCELKTLLPRFAAAIKNNVRLVEQEYDERAFYEAIGIAEEPALAYEAEKGERCRRCYQFRLRRAWQYAADHNFDYFCTTLSISPFKDAQKINEIGMALARSFDGETLGAAKKTQWLPSDFKKKGGFKRSLELSEEYGLYRQQYCGCVYSKQNTEKMREERV